jgi:phosphoesterase RecJ-like protein
VCPAPEGAALAYDLIISVDSSDPERLGKCGEALRNSGRPLIQLDHHQTNLLFGDANLVNAAQASACEVVLDWLDRLGWTLSPEVAQSLLTGIVTDTLCFRTSNVTAETFEKAQRLMRAGAALVEIVQYTMARMSTNLIRLYGRVLPKMQIEKGVIWVAVTREDFAAAGMQNGNYTGLSGYLIQADEACISASFIATNGNDVECSFRAVPGYDVGQIALRLGGGGHVLAGGCTLRGVTLEEALAQVLPLLQAEAARGKPVYQLPS